MSDRYQSKSAAEHRESAPAGVRCAVITVSDTRDRSTDKSGPLVAEALLAAGHTVVERQILADDLLPLRERVAELVAREDVDAILLTGGTGIAPRDCTPEAVGPLLTKHLPGYGELLRMLSYQEIGPAAMLSRAEAGLIGRTAVFTMPGSTAAVRLAMERVIVPELAHLVGLGRGGGGSG